MRDLTREDFLTVAELAQRLRVTEQSVRSWIDAGSLPAVRIGRRVRVLRSDFDALVSNRYRPRKSEAKEERAQAFWDGSWLPEAVEGHTAP